MTGSVNGLPFALKIDVTAISSRACAPKPYTVSVGNATNLPSFNNDDAKFRPSFDASIIYFKNRNY